MNSKDFVYPVLEINKKGEFDISTSEEWLLTMFGHDVGPKCARIGHIVVDSEGRAAQVKEVKFARGKGLFWGYTIFFDRIVLVELVFGELFDMPVDLVRNKIMREVERLIPHNPDYWREHIQELSGAKTVRDLIGMLLPHSNRRGTFC